MLEVLGFVLAVLGLVFAFEPPRRALLRFFRKHVDLIQNFTIATSVALKGIETRELRAGVNKHRALVWTVRNNSGSPIQLTPGIVMRPSDPAMTKVRLGLPEFTKQLTLLPNHNLVVLNVELTPSEVDHFRHWVRESTGFGIRTSDGLEHWIDDSQFVAFGVGLEALAKEFGLAENLPEGKLLQVFIDRK